MDKNGTINNTEEFQPPAREVRDLAQVEEGKRFMYVRRGDGYVLHPTLLEVVERGERELENAEREHRCEMTELENQIITERCRRLEREAAEAAGRPDPQSEPPPENSFTKQLAKLKSGLIH